MLNVSSKMFMVLLIKEEEDTSWKLRTLWTTGGIEDLMRQYNNIPEKIEKQIVGFSNMTDDDMKHMYKTDYIGLNNHLLKKYQEEKKNARK